MIFGPIFSAELVTTARRARYYFVRVGYPACLFAMLWAAYESSFRGSSGTVELSEVADFAQAFFGYFSLIQLIVILFLSPAMTAGTIAQERERRTIEYLFATDLRNHEIVLGKFAARLVVTLCQVLAGLPILALAMLMGGIEPRQLAMVFIISLSTLIALAALGIAVSVWAPRARDAVTRVYVILFALLFLPMVGAFPNAWEWVQAICQPFLAANPLWILWAVFTPIAPFLPSGWTAIWILVVSHGVLTIVCVLSSLVAVRRVHLKASGTPAKPKARLGLGAGERRRRGIGHLPMLWKEMFIERSANKLGVLGNIAMLLIVVAVVGLTGWWFIDAMGRTPGRFFGRTPVEYYLWYAIPMGSFLGSFSLLVLAARASGAITAEKDRDTWDSLLCTPLTSREIITAKVLGNLYALRWVLLLPIFVYLPALFFAMDMIVALPFILGTQLVLYLFVTTLGILFSLNSRNTLRAMGLTLLVTIFLGGGYLLCCCMPMALGGGDFMEVVMFAPCMPFLLSMPGVGFIELQDGHTMDNDMFAAYVMGMVAYALAALVLYGISVSSFDELSGRTSGRFRPTRLGQQPPRLGDV